MAEQWVVRWGNRWLRQNVGDGGGRSADTLEEAGKWPTEEAARKHLAETTWGKNAVVERIDVPNNNAEDSDVNELLRRADAWARGECVTSKVDLVYDLCVALRAERKRAYGQTRRADANFTSMLTAQEHLHAVLDHAWPDGFGPLVVRKARAFLVREGRDELHGEALYLAEIKRRVETAIGFTIDAGTPMHLVPQIVEDAVRKMAEVNAALLQEHETHEKTKRERDDALETIRVLRLRIDGIADAVWKGLPRE